MALGATLYMPANRPALAADLTKQAAAGVTSVVVCLEDSVADERLAEAEANLVTALDRAARRQGPAELPLLFVRVRAAAQIPALVARLGPGGARARRVRAAQVHRRDRHRPTCTRWTRPTGGPAALLVMPVLESGAVLYAETRVDELTRLHALLHRDRRPHPRRPPRRHRPLRALRAAPLARTCPSTT